MCDRLFSIILNRSNSESAFTAHIRAYPDSIASIASAQATTKLVAPYHGHQAQRNADSEVINPMPGKVHVCWQFTPRLPRVCHRCVSPRLSLALLPDLLLCYQATKALLERVAGIEPASLAWEANVLPLNYTRLPLEF